MRKKIKNKIVIFSLVLFFIVGAIVGAASEYYKFVWNSNIVEVLEHNDYVTNDVIRDGDKFVSVGFNYQTNSNGYENPYPLMVVFDKNGEVIKEVDLTDDLNFQGYAKRVIKVDDNFLIFSFVEYYVNVTVVNSNYEIINDYSFENNDVEYKKDFIDSFEIFIEEDEDNYYFIPGSFVDSYIYVIKKDLSDSEIFYGPYYEENTTDDYEYNYEGKVKELYDSYKFMLGEEFILRTVGSAEYTYVPRFVTKINDNYLFGIYNKDLNKSIIRLVNPQEEETKQLVWEKEFEEKFINTAVMFNNKILLADNKSIQILDLNGEILAEDLLSNYINSESIGFISEHFIYIDNDGFALTGTEEVCEIELPEDSGVTNVGVADIKGGAVPEISGEIPLLPDGSLPPAGATEADKGGMDVGSIPPDVQADVSNCGMAEVLYFSVLHRITTKTDANGKVEATHTTASWGDAIKFTITPNEGYVLGEIKVYDANGNPVEFEIEGNSFIMPNADVTIDVTFTVENVDTITFVSLSIIIVVIVSAIVLIKVRKKAKFYEV